MAGAKYLVMLGSEMECPGGISSVVKAYHQSGMFERWHVRYISTFKASAMRIQIVVMFRALCAIAGLLLRRQVFLVHAHSASRGSFWRKSVCCAVIHMFRVPYIFHIHSGEFSEFYWNECGALSKWWVRLTLHRAARVIALTETWRSSLLKIAPNTKLEVIGNPIEIPANLPSRPEAASRILFLGRLREEKGVFELVRAIPYVLKHVPYARFVLAGDGDADAVRRLAESLAVEKAIELPGWIDGHRKNLALQEADILTLPSHAEGLPVSILEAMAGGVAVVATNVGGIPDAIEKDVSGLIVTPGDVQGLAVAITTLLTDSTMRMRMRDAAYTRVQKFAVENIVRQVDRCFSSIVMPLRESCAVRGGAGESG